jgi:ribosomal protein S18 acetylase RimI-like enzyme
MEAQVVVLTKAYLSALQRFSCSDALLDTYLQRYAWQEQQSMKNICYLLVNQDQKIIGFFTLGTSILKATHLPFHVHAMTKSRSGHHPILMIKRFAVSVEFQGKGFGRHLLIVALKQAAMSSHLIGASALFVNQIDGTTAAFYQKLGFIPLPNQEKLFVPIKQLHALFLPFH